MEAFIGGKIYKKAAGDEVNRTLSLPHNANRNDAKRNNSTEKRSLLIGRE
jgi:hypothetical protein